MPLWRYVCAKALLGISTALQWCDRRVIKAAKAVSGPAPVPLLDRENDR